MRSPRSQSPHDRARHSVPGALALQTRPSPTDELIAPITSRREESPSHLARHSRPAADGGGSTAISQHGGDWVAPSNCVRAGDVPLDPQVHPPVHPAVQPQEARVRDASEAPNEAACVPCPPGVADCLLGDRNRSLLRKVESLTKTTIQQARGQALELHVRGSSMAQHHADQLIRALGDARSAVADPRLFKPAPIIRRVCRELGIAQTLTVKCEGRAVSAILGPKGSIIRGIERETVTSIVIDRRGEPCVIYITGQARNANQASLLVQGRVQRRLLDLQRLAGFATRLPSGVTAPHRAVRPNRPPFAQPNNLLGPPGIAPPRAPAGGPVRFNEPLPQPAGAHGYLRHPPQAPAPTASVPGRQQYQTAPMVLEAVPYVPVYQPYHSIGPYVLVSNVMPGPWM